MTVVVRAPIKSSIVRGAPKRSATSQNIVKDSSEHCSPTSEPPCRSAASPTLFSESPRSRSDSGVPNEFASLRSDLNDSTAASTVASISTKNLSSLHHSVGSVSAEASRKSPQTNHHRSRTRLDVDPVIEQTGDLRPRQPEDNTADRGTTNPGLVKNSSRTDRVRREQGAGSPHFPQRRAGLGSAQLFGNRQLPGGAIPLAFHELRLPLHVLDRLMRRARRWAHSTHNMSEGARGPQIGGLASSLPEQRNRTAENQAPPLESARRMRTSLSA